MLVSFCTCRIKTRANAILFLLIYLQRVEAPNETHLLLAK
ncbi:hypothetical protein RINTHH_150 [Richelia intracellularis HH01]|uniref:Uncharacterized protein n=1 Tax=Richelia intracellularis HH01 TaxID=1165094 RepID=M1X242_9NOST|nr:hypothetical protein RINTHH_150 [Richelia intracellularis HH01]